MYVLVCAYFDTIISEKIEGKKRVHVYIQILNNPSNSSKQSFKYQSSELGNQRRKMYYNVVYEKVFIMLHMKSYHHTSYKLCKTLSLRLNTFWSLYRKKNAELMIICLNDTKDLFVALIA
jgi:hypothetical protein